MEQERQALVEMREAGQEREIRLEKEKMEFAQAQTETQRQLDEKVAELEKLEGQALGTEADDYSLKSELYEKELALEVEMQRTAAVQCQLEQELASKAAAMEADPRPGPHFETLTSAWRRWRARWSR